MPVHSIADCRVDVGPMPRAARNLHDRLTMITVECTIKHAAANSHPPNGESRMTVLERPSTAEIDAAVRAVLESGEPVEFSDLEANVQERLPKLASHLLVRQAAWRLINANYAEVVSGMRVRKR